MSKKKTTFLLKGINNIEVIKNFDLKVENNSNEQNHDITMINELKLSSDTQQYSFMDDSKKIHNCQLTMLNSDKKDIQTLDNIHCFWCKLRIDGCKIGCPVRYIPNEIVKKYDSIITNDTYKICEQTSNTTPQDNVINHNFYECDGVFCSFNCCYAYILDNRKSYEYKHSLMLLSKIYYDMFNVEFNINPAPDWKLLSIFGGPLHETQFKENFNKNIYINLNQYITKVPKQYPIGYIYEEKIKF